MSMWIGPFGALVEVKCPAALPITRAPVSSYSTTLGGEVFEQRVVGRGRREWQATFPNATRPEQVNGLRALLDGAFGVGPWAWVDPWAAVTNLLTPDAALMAEGTWQTAGTSLVLGPVTADDGTWLPSSLSSDGTPVFVGLPTVGTGDRQAVPAQREVTGSIYVVGEVTVTLRFTDAALATVGQEQVSVSSAGTPTRAVITATAPAGTAGVAIIVNGASLMAGPQVTMTDVALPWAPGEGANRVSIDGLGVTPIAARSNLRVGSQSITIREVG